MSYAAYSGLRKLLTQDVNVTSYVTASNIRVGFDAVADVFPCITLSQTGGTTYGFTGYGESPAGSKMRMDERIFQIDIYSRTGIENLELISDTIDVAVMSGSGFRKISDNDIYEDELKAHRKIQTWSFWDIVND